MSSSIADHEIDQSSKPPEPSAKVDAANAAGDDAAGDDFSDTQETVISKNPPLAVAPSAPADFKIIRGGPKEIGHALKDSSLEHFDLMEFVGGGGMGAVFRAVDTKLSRTVAVKVLSHERTDDETRQRFQNEAQNAARLDHENIARVYHVGEDKGLHYIVFEFIEGINIRDLVAEKGALPLNEAISYVLQVAEALQHASERDVVHRDIKPSNVLITAKGRAKLVDMGLARLHHMESDSEDLTASGVTLGTFDYISPEQARDPRLADVRSDLYSLGCTFYFMLTGRPPFPEGTVLQKLLSHSTDDPSDPRLMRPELDEELVGIISRLLAKQPDQRYQQPSEFVGELLLVARRLNLTGISGHSTVWVARRRSLFSIIERSLPMVLPVAALLVAAFALDRMWSGPPQPDFDQDQIELGPPVKPSRSESPLPSEAHNGEGGPTTATPPQTDDDVDIDATTDAPMAITEKDTVEPTAPVEGTTAPTEPEEPPSKRDASAEPPADEPSVDANTPGAALPAAGPPAMDGANTIPAEADTEGEAEPATVESDGAVEQP